MSLSTPPHMGMTPSWPSSPRLATPDPTHLPAAPRFQCQQSTSTVTSAPRFVNSFQCSRQFTSRAPVCVAAAHIGGFVLALMPYAMQTQLRLPLRHHLWTQKCTPSFWCHGPFSVTRIPGHWRDEEHWSNCVIIANTSAYVPGVRIANTHYSVDIFRIVTSRICTRRWGLSHHLSDSHAS